MCGPNVPFILEMYSLTLIILTAMAAIIGIIKSHYGSQIQTKVHSFYKAIIGITVHPARTFMTDIVIMSSNDDEDQERVEQFETTMKRHIPKVKIFLISGMKFGQINVSIAKWHHHISTTKCVILIISNIFIQSDNFEELFHLFIEERGVIVRYIFFGNKERMIRENWLNEDIATILRAIVPSYEILNDNETEMPIQEILKDLRRYTVH